MFPRPGGVIIHACVCVRSGAVEAELIQRAQLTYTRQVLSEVTQAAGSAAGAVRQARLGLRLTGLLGALVNGGIGAIRRRAEDLAIASDEATLASAVSGGSRKAASVSE